eukprot:scaffold77078_cov31-Tisochrysis_lutea.AAC.1
MEHLNHARRAVVRLRAIRVCILVDVERIEIPSGWLAVVCANKLAYCPRGACGQIWWDDARDNQEAIALPTRVLCFREGGELPRTRWPDHRHPAKGGELREPARRPGTTLRPE